MEWAYGNGAFDLLYLYTGKKPQIFGLATRARPVYALAKRLFFQCGGVVGAASGGMM